MHLTKLFSSPIVQKKSERSALAAGPGHPDPLLHRSPADRLIDRRVKKFQPTDFQEIDVE